jgi:riboflavin synthase
LFTGIIQSIGSAEEVESLGDGIRLKVVAPNFFHQSEIGHSTAINGVCLTIETVGPDFAWFTLVRQTLNSSAFRTLVGGDLLNLELSCKPDSFLGGHYVMGHVDGVAEVKVITELETGWEVLLKMPAQAMKYIISKGSITLHGISLTVAEKSEDSIKIAVIPETLRKTNLRNWRIGTLINFEVDVVGKYIENFIAERLNHQVQF